MGFASFTGKLTLRCHTTGQRGIPNEFINAKQNGQRPDLQVALYEYGKSSLSAREGYIRQIQPLTTDLDKISEELFKLKTNGGEEYCGWVIQAATENLAWSKGANDFKAIFIAGNEPFTQGPVAYAQACKAAIEKGIIINTIHCGAQATASARSGRTAHCWRKASTCSSIRTAPWCILRRRRTKRLPGWVSS